MFIFALLLILFIGSIFFIPIRLTLLHPILTIKYLVIDIYHYFVYKQWRVYKTGRFDCFDASLGKVFGSGKTLSAVYQTKKDFMKYHNKKIFDVFRMKWVTQKVHILTNLSLKNLPYEHLMNLGQIITSIEKAKADDEVNDTLTCTIVLIDECQNQLNCRSFKDNLSPLLLRALTECRHYSMNFYYDAPRFSQCDSLLRQCTSNNIKCNKVWRWQIQSVYDAQDVENASNINLVKPYTKTGFFVENSLFDEYDTKEIISELVKAKERGDFLTDEEILTLQNNQEFDIDAIRHKSKYAKKRLKSIS